MFPHNFPRELPCHGYYCFLWKLCGEPFIPVHKLSLPDSEVLYWKIVTVALMFFFLLASKNTCFTRQRASLAWLKMSWLNQTNYCPKNYI